MNATQLAAAIAAASAAGLHPGYLSDPTEHPRGKAKLLIVEEARIKYGSPGNSVQDLFFANNVLPEYWGVLDTLSLFTLPGPKKGGILWNFRADQSTAMIVGEQGFFDWQHDWWQCDDGSAQCAGNFYRAPGVRLFPDTVPGSISLQSVIDARRAVFEKMTKAEIAEQTASFPISPPA